jgi:hypothetical protein
MTDSRRQRPSRERNENVRKILLVAVGAVAMLAAAACEPEEDGANVVEQPPSDTSSTEPADDNDEPQGTLENPLDTGVAFELTDWIVEFGSTNTDAEDAIAEGIEFSEPAPDGRQYIMAEITVSYTGEEPSDPFVDLGFEFHGSDGTAYGSGESDLCGLIPNDLFEVGEMSTDDSATANICMAVPADAIEGGAWSVEYLWDLDDSDRTYVVVG